MSSYAASARNPLRYPVSAYDQRSAMLFLALMMLVLLVVAVFPILYSFWVSLFDLKLTRPQRVPFVGLDNYVHVFNDPLFWASVARTTSFTVMSVTAIMLIALLMALLLNEQFRGRRFLSAMLLVPWAIPYVANGLMWKWIYDSGYGALNGVLYQLDFIDKYMIWLGDTNKTLALIANAFVWKEVPLATILLLVDDEVDPGRPVQRRQGRRRQRVATLLPCNAAIAAPRVRAGDDLRNDDGDTSLRPLLHPHRGRPGGGVARRGVGRCTWRPFAGSRSAPERRSPTSSRW